MLKRYSKILVVKLIIKNLMIMINSTVLCDKLLNEKIIGWFQGKMEFRPRALGNRSIVSSPQSKY